MKPVASSVVLYLLLLLIVGIMFWLQNHFFREKQYSPDFIEQISRDDPLFFKMALGKEFSSNNLKKITRWNKKTLTYSVNGSYNKKDLSDIDSILQGLHDLTKLNFQQIQRGGDFTITFNSKITGKNSIVSENADHIKGLALCSLHTFSNNLKHCDIQIVKDYENEPMRGILLEELTQAISGIFWDSTDDSQKDSVFYKYKQNINDYLEYTESDKRIIRKMYTFPNP